ncbi:MAG: coenzyme F420-0:L-glutamate ligase [Acidobacteria bacterium]|nr:coenzyme F420-0:L-glutamate ligase [Acidobacteriota bacterium]
MSDDLHVFAVPGIPEIASGVDLARLIAGAVGSGSSAAKPVRTGDVFVVAQKIVSKAEGASVKLDTVFPSQMALAWADANGKDAKVIEVVLGESRRIVRMDQGVLITETHHGFVCANAGVDMSNVTDGWVTLLPRDPDASAERLRAGLTDAFGCPVGVIVADTVGRPWREGFVNVAIGVAGLQPLIDYRGSVDAFGRRLEATIIALADEIAGAAEIVMRKSSQIPVAIVRGAAEWAGQGSAKALLRQAGRDLFR